MDFSDNYTQTAFIFSTKMIWTTCLALSNQYYSNIKSDVVPTGKQLIPMILATGMTNWGFSQLLKEQNMALFGPHERGSLQTS